MDILNTYLKKVFWSDGIDLPASVELRQLIDVRLQTDNDRSQFLGYGQTPRLDLSARLFGEMIFEVE